jgi:uncharacterized protein (TIGR02266 family)
MRQSNAARVWPGPEQSSRREHPRFGVDLDVSLGSDHNFYSGLTENLSAGGVFIATHLLRPIGEIMEVCIHLPGEAEVRALGEVRWVRVFNPECDEPPGMGVRFLQMDPSSRQAIDEFVQRRQPLLYD